MYFGGDIALGISFVCGCLSYSTTSDLLLRLENLGEATVQLRERNWRIFSLSGGEIADQNEKFKQYCRDMIKNLKLQAH